MKNSPMRISRISRISLVSLAVSAFVAACGGGSSSITGSSAQPQSARATPPASCSYAHVWVTVTALRVLGDASAGPAWQDIALAAPQRIDLLATNTGVLQALGAAPLAPGHYTQVRLILADQGNTVQPTGGAEAALNVPSGSSSGLKLTGDITVQAGAALDIALTAFDPCTSVVATGNGGYNLKPADLQMQPVAQAGPEVVGPAGAVLPAPGGGYELASQAAFGSPWTLQRYDATGTATGASFTVTTGDDIVTAFAALAGGGTAAVWLNYTGTLGVYQVTTQAWDASGHALSPPTAVALVDPGQLGHPPALPKIAALPGGGYVLVWGLPPGQTGVYAQRFTDSGAPAAPAVQATASGTGSLGVTALTAGGYVVSWGQFAATGGVQAFSATDVPLASAQAAGSNGDGGGPPIPVLSGLTGGGAVIAWQAVHEHVMMQQLAPDGTPVTPVQVVDDQSGTLIFASIAIGALPDGGSVIVWSENGDVFARRYLASGAPAGPQTKINLVSTQAGGPVGIAVLADGSFQVHWNALDSGGTRQWFVRSFPATALVAP